MFCGDTLCPPSLKVPHTQRTNWQLPLLVLKLFFFSKCVKNVFFSPIDNFLINLSFESQRYFALLSVFIILSTTLTCRLCCFYGMFADTGFFFFIVDIELGVICWAESLDGSDETKENQVGSATTAYKCWNQKTSELLTTPRNNTPMCKNRRSRSEICVFSFLFFFLE